MQHHTLSDVSTGAGCSLATSTGGGLVRRGAGSGRLVLVALVEHRLELVHLVLLDSRDVYVSIVLLKCVDNGSHEVRWCGWI